MEPVMYHYEAVLRKVHVMQGEEFDLQDFYKTRYFDISPVLVKVKVPRVSSLVHEVDDFSDIEAIIGFLCEGRIVVSKAHSEVGVEYLAPFELASNGELYVACVQCKFVYSSTNCSEISKKMDAAVRGLERKKVRHIPVVYTTVDQQKINKRTFQGGVYFIEKDIFEFTKRLGILRLHTQKLGQVPKPSIPF